MSTKTNIEATEVVKKMLRALKSCKEELSGTRFKRKTYDETLVSNAIDIANNYMKNMKK